MRKIMQSCALTDPMGSTWPNFTLTTNGMSCAARKWLWLEERRVKRALRHYATTTQPDEAMEHDSMAVANTDRLLRCMWLMCWFMSQTYEALNLCPFDIFYALAIPGIRSTSSLERWTQEVHHARACND